MLATDVHDLGADETLAQSEHVGIRASLNLAQQTCFRLIQKLQPRRKRQAVGKEFLREVEAAAANDIAIDVPANALRYLDALGVATVSARAIDDFHGVSS